MDPERIEESRTIPAPPAAIFRVLCDPDGHVDIDSSGDPVWRERDIFPIISAGALRATLGILARTVARRAAA